LEISLKESINHVFMDTLASFVETKVEGGRQKMASEGKGKLKEKLTKPPSTNAFVEVPLN
jgi:hypothetical protein